MKKKLPPCFAFKNTGKHPRKVEAEDSYEFELSYPHETADESTAIKSLPSLDEAGIAAVKILHRVSPELSEKEQSFFVAGFQECIKWLKLNSEPEKKVEPKSIDEALLFKIYKHGFDMGVHWKINNIGSNPYEHILKEKFDLLMTKINNKHEKTNR